MPGLAREDRAVDWIELSVKKADWDEIRRVVIGPAQAAEWLRGADNFRPNLNTRNLDSIMRAMKEDRYRDNGDPIRISPDGKCVDGQHRLTAIVRTGTWQTLTVMSGFVGDARMLDTGRRVRTITDYMRHEKVKNCTTAASITRNDLSQKRGEGFWVASRTVLSIDELMNHYWNHATTIQLACKQANRTSKIVTRSVGGAIWLMFHRLDRLLADSFFDCLSGDRKALRQLRPEDPMHMLRDRFLRSARQGASKSEKLDPVSKGALMIKVWNDWRGGKSVKKALIWRKSGPAAESFPEIV